MISPMTPPGTKVVCINAGCGTQFVHSVFGMPSEMFLKLGSVYTVVEIRMHPFGCLAALLQEVPEIPDGFALQRFRRLDLPESLTSLLKTTPVEGLLVANAHDPQSHLRSVMVLPHHDTAGGASRKFVSPAFSSISER